MRTKDMSFTRLVQIYLEDLEDGGIPELGSLTLDLYPDINQYQGYRLLRHQPQVTLFLKGYCAPCLIALDRRRPPSNQTHLHLGITTTHGVMNSQGPLANHSIHHRQQIDTQGESSTLTVSSTLNFKVQKCSDN